MAARKRRPLFLFLIGWFVFLFFLGFVLFSSVFFFLVDLELYYSCRLFCKARNYRAHKPCCGSL